MPSEFKPYIPQDIGELADYLSFMLLYSPTFTDDSGYFPERPIETVFDAFNEGLRRLRPELGCELYQRFMQTSDQVRACLEADPENKTGETGKGRALIREMEELVEARARRS